LYTNKEGSLSTASSDNVQRRNARTNQAVREHESEQQAAAIEELGVQEQAIS
jgi:hypothetical protein